MNDHSLYQLLIKSLDSYFFDNFKRELTSFIQQKRIDENKEISVNPDTPMLYSTLSDSFINNLSAANLLATMEVLIKSNQEIDQSLLSRYKKYIEYKDKIREYEPFIKLNKEINSFINYELDTEAIETEREALLSQITRYKEEIQNRDEIYSQLLKDHDENEKKLAIQSENVRTLEDEKVRLLDKLEKYRNELSNLEQGNIYLSEQNDQKTQELNTQHHRSQKYLSTISGLKAEIEKLEGEISEKDQQLIELKESNKDLSVKIAKIRIENDRLLKEASSYQGNISRMQEEFEQKSLKLKQRVETLEKDLKASNTQLEQLFHVKRDLQKTRDEKAKLEQTVIELKKGIAKLEGAIEDLQFEIRTKDAELNSAKEVKETSLEQEMVIAQKEFEIQRQVEQVGVLREENTKLKEELRAGQEVAKTTLTKLIDQLEASRAQEKLLQQAAIQVEDQLKALLQENTNQEAQITQLHKTLKDYKDELEDNKGKVNDLEKERVAFQSYQDSTKTQLDTLHDQLEASLAQEIALGQKAEQTVIQTQAQIRQLEKANSDQADELRQLKVTLQEYKDSLKTSQDQESLLNQRIITAEADKLKAERDLVLLRDEQAETKLHATRLEEQFTSVLQKKSDQDDQIVRLNKTLGDYQAQLEENENKIESLQREIETFKSNQESTTAQLVTLHDQLEASLAQEIALGQKVFIADEAKQKAEQTVIQTQAQIRKLEKDNSDQADELRKLKLTLQESGKLLQTSQDQESILNQRIITAEADKLKAERDLVLLRDEQEEARLHAIRLEEQVTSVLRDKSDQDDQIVRLNKTLGDYQAQLEENRNKVNDLEKEREAFKSDRETLIELNSQLIAKEAQEEFLQQQIFISERAKLKAEGDLRLLQDEQEETKQTLIKAQEQIIYLTRVTSEQEERLQDRNVEDSWGSRVRSDQARTRARRRIIEDSDSSDADDELSTIGRSTEKSKLYKFNRKRLSDSEESSSEVEMKRRRKQPIISAADSFEDKNIIAKLFYKAQTYIDDNQDRGAVSRWLSDELSNLNQCNADTIHQDESSEIIEFRSQSDNSCLQLEITAKDSGQPQIRILPTPIGTTPFSGAITIQRIDPISGNFLDLYDNIRIEANKIVEIISPSNPTQENSRIADLIKNDNETSPKMTKFPVGKWRRSALNGSSDNLTQRL